MNRKQRRAGRTHGATPVRAAPANTASRDRLAELFAAAIVQHQSGAIAEAERSYRRIIALLPDFADAHSRLGALLLARGNAAEAVAQIEQALALRPNTFEALGNLAQAHMLAGAPNRAIEPAGRALELNDTPQTRTLFAHCLGAVRPTEDNGRIRTLAFRALSEGWGRPRTLTGACVSLIKLNPVVAEWIARSNAAWPGRLSPDELLASPLPATLAADHLLLGLLKYDPVTDIGLERLLTNMRHALLQDALSEPPGADEAGPLLELACALASQCFINEYVFSQTETETADAQRLRRSLEAPLPPQAKPPSLWPAMVGAYWPLEKLADAKSLLERRWPSPVATLIAQQVGEPAQERELASTIPALTELDDEVSRLVRQQYEESPYPRWTSAGGAQRPAARPASGSIHIPDVLIAGCGTGLGAIEFAREASHVRILAIDLSLASLSYAKRMAQTLGVTNIEFAQADINKLGSIRRTFDFIDASGVLHHLADPWRGWRVLLSLLRPGGTMQVCLYSALARQNVVAGRALIAERGYRPFPEDIRRCREAILAAEDSSPLQSLARADDFFSASELRDMLFHVQEHRITLPEIKSFLAENKLEFAGFNLDQAALRQFGARFPGQTALLDLDRWHRYEIEVPSTFLGMYRFSVRKAAT